MKRYLNSGLGYLGRMVGFGREEHIPSDEEVQESVRRSVYSAIIHCSQRVDLSPDDLLPHHNMDWVFGRINENKELLLLVIQNRIIPQYVSDSSRGQIQIKSMKQAGTVGKLTDYVYNFIKKESIRRDVYSTIVGCSQRKDLIPDELNPNLELDSVFNGINENRTVLLLAVQHKIIPRYVSDPSRRQIPIERVRQTRTVGEFVDCVYGFIQDASKKEPENANRAEQETHDASKTDLDSNSPSKKEQETVR